MIHLAIDTETDLIAQGRLAPRLACVAMQASNEDKPSLYLPADFCGPFIDWINQNTGWLIGHNIAYDLLVLLRAEPSLTPFIWSLYEQGRIWDLGIHERLYTLGHGWSMHPAIGKPIVTNGVSLEALARGLLGISYGDLKSSSEGPRLQYKNLIGLPLDQWGEDAKTYALLDAEVTLKVGLYQFERLYECSWKVSVNRGFGQTYSLPSQFIQIQSAWALHHLGAWGVRVSSDRVKEWKEALHSKRDVLKTLLQDDGLIDENGKRSMKEIKERVATAYGKRTPRTEKGAIQTSGEVLKESGDPTLLKLAEYMELDKVKTTFEPTLDQGAKRAISPRWNVLVRSGRASCTKPNLQQLPREGGVRECFTPRQGFIYVGADYSTAELVALAHVCEEWGLVSKMAQAIREGYDLHLLLASSMLKISYEEAKERLADGDGEIKTYRQLAKVPNFGLSGGLGVEGLRGFAKSSYNIELSQQEAKELKTAWFKQWSEMASYFKRIEQATEQGYIVQSFSGRRRGGIGYTDGANTMFQGLVADGAKLALYEVVKECYTDKSSDLYGSKPILFIHDEIILESPKEKASEAGERLAVVMKERMKKVIPHLPIEVDAWISSKWSKSNKTVYDEKGKLAPC